MKWSGEDESLCSELGEPKIHKTDWTAYELLTRAGWRVIDSIAACGDLDSYRYYIESSKAEWSVAKNAYVLGQPGWFSERSACYLAAGRPVVVQDTGSSAVLPVGEGILSFRTLPEAAEGIQEVQARYLQHSEAARAIAETYFDSEKVLSDLIDNALNDDGGPADAVQRRRSSDLNPASADAGRSARGNNPVLVQNRLKILRTDLIGHPAVKAWAELCPKRVEPQQIEILKEKAKGAVYRLAGVGPRNSAVIAKRCRQERAVIERPVYEEVLSRLPVPAVRYYGCVEEADGRFWWLFLENVGDETYSPFVEQHITLAAQWLGLMHTAGEDLEMKSTLPDRGPNHYLSYLQSARRSIPQLRAIRSLKPTDQTILQNIVSMCEYLETSWDQVVDFCSRMPRTFVHGDCLAKNVHVRTTQDGLTIVPFDWGGAGWGLPATDLGQLGLPYRHLPPTDPDCATYVSVVRERWPNLDLHVVRQLANLGQMFWSLKVIGRSVPEIDSEGTHIESLMAKFSVYKSILVKTIRAARWED
jgi:hypothetical protein